MSTNCSFSAECPTCFVATHLPWPLFAAIEVHFPVGHIGHVTTAIEKLHNFLARTCQFCPTRACAWVLLKTSQHLVLKPKIHLTQLGTARVSHKVTLAS
jgi:hypothetical protein